MPAKRNDATKPKRDFRALLPPLASVASGCLFFLSVATFDIWLLAWISLVPLLWAINGQRGFRPFLLGWIAGTVTNLGGFYWIPHLLTRFGHLPQVVALPLFTLLAAYQGLHWGVFAYLTNRIRGRWPRLPLALLAPLLMTSLELVTPFIFDWYMAISQAWVVPVIQVADLAGPLGVTFLLVMVNAMLFEVSRALLRRERFPRWAALAVVGVLSAALGYGFLRIDQVGRTREAAPKVQVGVVQANIGITEKGSAGLAARHHGTHLEQSRLLQQRGAELLIWPESSYPFAIDRARSRDYHPGDVRQIMQGLRVPLIFGAVSFNRGDPSPYNSAFMLDQTGRFVGRFDKNFLLMFGEYIPFYDTFPQLKRWVPAMSNFTAGREVTTFPFGEYRVGPMICYEDILPRFGRRLAELRPNLLVNITNDAWFGLTSEPYQHLALSVYRSVELRLDLVRAVNTGVSVFIDATGRLVAQTEAHDPAVTPDVRPETLLHQAALMPPPGTIYARVGDLFGYLNLSAALVLVLLTLRRRQQNPMGGRRPKRRGKR